MNWSGNEYLVIGANCIFLTSQTVTYVMSRGCLLDVDIEVVNFKIYESLISGDLDRNI